MIYSLQLMSCLSACEYEITHQYGHLFAKAQPNCFGTSLQLLVQKLLALRRELHTYAFTSYWTLTCYANNVVLCMHTTFIRITKSKNNFLIIPLLGNNLLLVIKIVWSQYHYLILSIYLTCDINTITKINVSRIWLYN